MRHEEIGGRPVVRFLRLGLPLPSVFPPSLPAMAHEALHHVCVVDVEEDACGAVEVFLPLPLGLPALAALGEKTRILGRQSQSCSHLFASAVTLRSGECRRLIDLRLFGCGRGKLSAY